MHHIDSSIKCVASVLVRSVSDFSIRYTSTGTPVTALTDQNLGYLVLELANGSGGGDEKTKDVAPDGFLRVGT